tara:strand:+ start:351 stop:1286 length:936 start_codon:yes stop_codon:yes gene_type:complete
MFKILTFIYLFMTLCLSGIAYAQDDYKIIVKVNNEIISNHDIKKEKDYLSALNPQILNIPENEIKKISKQSLIREIIKQREVSKYFDADYRPSNLTQMVRDLYTRLNVNSEEEFKNYLIKYDLNLKDVIKKIAIEANWNLLIYERYKNQINIDEDKIKKRFKSENSITKIEKLFLLSEIVFNAKNQEEYDSNYKKIADTIKERGFKTAATIYSLSDTAKFGGEIGWLSKRDINKKFYKQLSTLKINEFTKPIKIATGFMLLNLDDIKESKRESNLEEEFNKAVAKEKDRQLNQYSTIYYKKLEKQSFIYEK